MSAEEKHKQQPSLMTRIGGGQGTGVGGQRRTYMGKPAYRWYDDINNMMVWLGTFIEGMVDEVFGVKIKHGGKKRRWWK